MRHGGAQHDSSTTHMSLVRDLYPICRSITGDGVRESLRLIHDAIDGGLTIHEVPSGTRVHDWTVPDEWNLRRATLVGPDGTVFVDTDRSNLHVVSYSVPVSANMSLDELQPHLHSLADRPTHIPYRTAYWSRSWGLCLQHTVRASLVPGTYRVDIDTRLAPGSLSYGELLLPGTVGRRETLISAHVCHPSLANDNLSGIAVAAELVRRFRERPLHNACRFLFVPGTIGSITWLALNHEHALTNIAHGLVLTGLGDVGPFTYKSTRRGNTAIDRAATRVLGSHPEGVDHRLIPFGPYGYDERQYCSPGYDLAMGRLGRSTHGEYPEYHTSADDLTFVSNESIECAADVAEEMLRSADADVRYRSTAPFGEPQLGRRGLYRPVGGEPRPPEFEMAMLWVLNLADGNHTLADIAERSGLPEAVLTSAATALRDARLLDES